MITQNVSSTQQISQDVMSTHKLKKIDVFFVVIPNIGQLQLILMHNVVLEEIILKIVRDILVPMINALNVLLIIFSILIMGDAPPKSRIVTLTIPLSVFCNAPIVLTLTT
jgi:hypothetical protein